MTIVAGENKVLSVENPIGTEPQPQPQPEPTKPTPDKDKPATDKHDDKKADPKKPVKVDTLRSTGAGLDEGTNALAMAAVLSSAIAGAGALFVNRKR